MKEFTTKSTIELVPAEGCSGCTACKAVCPTNAISMQQDKTGFLYPIIDASKCIHCSLCVKTCPYTDEITNYPLSASAVKHKNAEEQLSSTSGGFAAAVANRVIDQGGSAYGVVTTKEFKVCTARATTREEAVLFKGSKYVQTDPGNTFREVASDLHEGRLVAFFGSSCHVDGLLHYLHTKGTDTTNLITVDFLCHGVPSPKLFEDYCAFASKRKPLKMYCFRTKANGWGFGSSTFSPTLVYERRRICNSPLARAWLGLFFSNNCLRPHCYNCPYATAHGRSADFTMADFWGLKQANPEFFDPKGVSLVLCNTEKASKLLSTFNELEQVSSSIAEATAKQTNFHSPSPKSPDYDKFWKDYLESGFEYVVRRYTSYNFKGQIKERIGKFLKKIGLR